MKLRALFTQKKIIIGMIHLPALPGYPSYTSIDSLIAFAINELKTLQSNGIHGVLIENESDKPHSVQALPEVIAALSVITREVVAVSHIPVGVEVLLNDPKASLAIALAGGAAFIRTDYFVDRMAREEYGGEMEIDATTLMNYRHKIGAAHIPVIADIQVKYATLLEKNKPISLSVKQAVAAGAAAVLVSGAVTGESPNLQELIDAKATTKSFPVMLGSGFSAGNAKDFLRYADGAIVGSSIKSNGKVDAKKVKNLMKVVQSL